MIDRNMIDQNLISLLDKVKRTIFDHFIKRPYLEYSSKIYQKIKGMVND